MTNQHVTCFASAERSQQDEVMRLYRIIANNNDLVTFLNGLASIVSVLNMNRQIVFVNKMIFEKAGITGVHQALGMRLGELFGCRHAHEINGCGTSSHCSTCGALRTMINCVTSGESIEEFSLTNTQMDTYDFRIHSTYTKAYQEEFIICSLFDISVEKRHKVIERIFFHDLMNTINGICGITNVLPMLEADKQPTYLTYLSRLMESLVSEIQSHRVLILAEKSEYLIAKDNLASLDFVSEEMERYRQLAFLEDKEIRITDDSENHVFVSDRTLLARVLGNMIKNALEAEPAGALIEVSVKMDVECYLNFSVHNDSVMRETDRLQVFNRSFSTKGANRGLGTYSMKLLTEKYLKGMISFVSQKGTGTTFTVRLPL